MSVFDRALPAVSQGMATDHSIRFEGFYNFQYMKHFRISSADLGDYSEVTPNYIGTNSVAIPVNYNELVRDAEYENWLRGFYDNYKWFEIYLGDILQQVEALKVKIINELYKRS